MTQPSFFDIETKFKAYHSDNPQVYSAFCEFAMQLIRAGRKHIGSKMIMERIRFESAVRANDKFKCNNTFTPHYARLFEKEHPNYAGIFETRKSKADGEI